MGSASTALLQRKLVDYQRMEKEARRDAAKTTNSAHRKAMEELADTWKQLAGYAAQLLADSTQGN